MTHSKQEPGKARLVHETEFEFLRLADGRYKLIREDGRVHFETAEDFEAKYELLKPSKQADCKEWDRSESNEPLTKAEGGMTAAEAKATMVEPKPEPAPKPAKAEKPKSK